jgi:hypothetical protein
MTEWGWAVIGLLVWPVLPLILGYFLNRKY